MDYRPTFKNMEYSKFYNIVNVGNHLSALNWPIN